jgi:hypothetical protein
LTSTDPGGEDPAGAREQVRDVHGMNLEDGFPPPEQLLDYHGANVPAGSVA